MLAVCSTTSTRLVAPASLGLGERGRLYGLLLEEVQVWDAERGQLAVDVALPRACVFLAAERAAIHLRALAATDPEAHEIARARGALAANDPGARHQALTFPGSVAGR